MSQASPVPQEDAQSEIARLRKENEELNSLLFPAKKAPKPPPEVRLPVMYRMPLSLKAQMEELLMSEFSGDIPYGEQQKFFDRAISSLILQTKEAKNVA